MKKLLVLYGSPRKEGASAEMLAHFLSCLQGWDTEIFSPYTMNLRPCNDNRFCHTSGFCPMEDAMKILYPKIDGAQGFLIASPIYFFSIPAPLKMLIDRLQPYWCRRILHKKMPPARLGASLFAGGAPPHEGQFVHAEALVGSVFRELGAENLGFAGFSNTDRSSLGSALKIDIQNLAEKFNRGGYDVF